MSTPGNELERILRTMSEGVARARGREFFQRVVVNLCRALDVDYAFVGELVSDAPERVRTVALASGGELGENMEYSLNGTPCEGVVERRTCVFPGGVADLFPGDPHLRELGAEGYLGTPLFDSGDQVLGIMVVMHGEPIERAQVARSAMEVFAGRAGAELERLRDEAIYSAAEARTGVGSWVLDLGSDRGHWSREMYRLFQWPEGKGSPSFDEFLALVHPEDRERLRETREEASGMADPRILDIRTNPERGPVRHLNLVMRWSPGLQEGPGRLSGNVLDMSERRSLERQLVQAQKMEAVGRLAGGIAHDFNNLLTVIVGEVEEGLFHTEDGSDVDGCLRRIRKTSLKAAALTRQLLEFSRTDQVDRTPLDLNEMVEEGTEILGRLLEERVTMEVRLSHEPLVVQGDKGRLEQVLVNLAVNARDAMPEGGTVTVETGTRLLDAEQAGSWGVEPGRYAVFSVHDTGLGVPVEIQDRIFEPFFTTKEAEVGSGLGLSTSYGIVTQLDGFIDLESRPGEGTTFTVGLPSPEAAERR